MKYRKLAVAVACVGLAVAAVSTTLYAADQPTPPAGVPAHQWKHPEMHRALHSLRQARVLLETAPHDFAGHRKAALDSTDEAIVQVVDGLTIENDLPPAPTTRPSVPGTKVEDKVQARKQLKEARGILETAVTELKKSGHGSEGHRAKAVELAEQAIMHIDEGLAATK